MQKSNKRIILIDGVINGGKTFVYNLLRWQGSFISLDVSDGHYKVYKDQTCDQIGKDNAERLEKFIMDTTIFEPDVLLREIGLLMKEFPNNNFVIKPGFNRWPGGAYYKEHVWEKLAKEHLSIGLNNIYSYFAIRHPKMAWVTSRIYMWALDDFIEQWKEVCQPDKLTGYQILKLEALDQNRLLKQFLWNVDLKNMITYSKFDLEAKMHNERHGCYDNLENDFKRIENEMGDIFEFFKYDAHDTNIDEFFNDNLTEEEKKISWSTV